MGGGSERMSDHLFKLRELASKLPKGLQSDWQGTNHYELTAPCGDNDYFWLTLRDDSWYEFAPDSDPSESQDGKRVGLLMDIAAEVCRLKDEGVL